MYETELRSFKSTAGTLRWDADIFGVNFAVYISRWRVPKPWPGRIRVRIYGPSELTEMLNESPKYNHQENEIPLTAVLCHVSDNGNRTTTYVPIDSDENSWELRRIYVPQSLLPDEPCQTLGIQVIWDNSQRCTGKREDR